MATVLARLLAAAVEPGMAMRPKPTMPDDNRLANLQRRPAGDLRDGCLLHGTG